MDEAARLTARYAVDVASLQRWMGSGFLMPKPPADRRYHVGVMPALDQSGVSM